MGIVARQQQQGLARINRTNPLGAKVIEHIPLAGSNLAIVSGAKVTPLNGKTVATTKGLSLRAIGTGGASVPLNLSAYNKITLCFWLFVDSFDNTDALAMEFGGPSFSQINGFLIDPNSGAPYSGLFSLGSGANAATSTAAFARPSAGAWHRYAVSLDRTLGGALGNFLAIDGVNQAASQGAGSVSGNFANDNLYLFSRNNASLFGTGNLQDITFYTGILSAAEIAADFANPYQIFDAPSKQQFPMLAAGVGGGAILQAAGVSQSIGSAALATQISFSSGGLSASAGSAALTTAVALAASGVSSSIGTAALSTQIALSAPGSSVSAGTASLTAGSSGLAAAGTSASTGAAALSTQIPLAASSASVSAGAAALTAPGQGLSVSGVSISTGSASLSTAVTLGASGTASSAGSAALSTSIALTAAAISKASGSAALTTGIALAAIGTASSSAAASLSTAVALQAAGVSASQGTVAFAMASNALAVVGLSQSAGAAQLATAILLQAASISASVGSAAYNRLAPTQRVLRINAESRVLAINAENRVLVLNPET